MRLQLGGVQFFAIFYLTNGMPALILSSMLAELSQIKSKPHSDRLNDTSKRDNEPLKRGNDSLFARLRRLELEVKTLNASLSAIRRDLWRIEKRSQRQDIPPAGKEDQPAPPAPDQFSPVLYG